MNSTSDHRWSNLGTLEVDPSITGERVDVVERCSEIIEHHSKSFSFASRFLPSAARADVAVLYAWCRRVDDLIDDSPRAEARHSLLQLRLELDAVYGEGDEALVEKDLILSAFRAVVERRQIPKRYPSELLEGMQMDVGNVSYDDLDALHLYCYRVAGVVGLMMCHILGLRDERALCNAAHLGVAMQLTNICRDVQEDWGRGRLYLPAQHLLAILSHQELIFSGGWRGTPTSQGTSGARRLPAPMREAARFVVHRLLREADRSYQIAYQGIPALPDRAGGAILAAGMIYQDIGRVLLARGCDPESPRAFTTRGRKRWLALRALLEAPLRRLWARLRGGLRTKTAPLSIPQRVFTFEELRESLRRK